MSIPSDDKILESSQMTCEDAAPTPSAASALSTFCDHLIEACWLVAAGVVPVLYDPLAVYRHLAIKMSVFNSLGLIVIGALVVGLVDRAARRRPVVPGWLIAVLALVVMLAISTVWSIDRPYSFWGGDAVLHGSFALFCQLGLFTGVAARLRTRAQLDRLVGMILAAGVPLALYAIFQRLGWDPISFLSTDYMPGSFAGHPLYAAGSLLLALPLCGWKLSAALTGLRERRGPATIVAACLYGVVLLILIAGLLATGKRGPFLGGLAIAACAAILYAVCWKKFRLACGAIIFTGCAILGLAGLAILARDNPSIKKVPILDRLSLIVPVGSGTGDAFRKKVWAKAPVISLSVKPVTFPDGQPDRWWRLRPVIGYGPETLQALFPQHIFLDGAAPGAAIESRFHNSFWDTIQSIGVLGLVATFCLNTLVFARGLQALRLRDLAVNPWRLLAAGSVLGFVTGVAMELFFGKGYFGLGFPVGFTGGLILWPLAAAWRDPHPTPSAGESWRLPGIALLSGIAAHWVDMSFSFQTANTSALSWVCAGALVALGRISRKPEDAMENSEEFSNTPGWLRAGLQQGVLAGAMLAALGHAFINNYTPAAKSMGTILETSLTRLLHNQEPSHLLPMLILPAWFVANLALGLDRLHGRKRQGSWKSLMVSGVTSLTIATTWAIWKSHSLGALAPFPSRSSPMEECLRKAAGMEALSAAFFLMLMSAVVLVAVLLHWRMGRTRPPGAKPVKVAFAFLTVAVCGEVIRDTQVPNLCCQASANFARRLENLGLNAMAAQVYKRVLQTYPREPMSRIQGSKAFMAVAEQSTDTKECLRTMKEAEAVLQGGLRISNRNVMNYFLGNVLMREALEMPKGEDKTAAAGRAKNALAAAVAYAPNTEVAWYDASVVERELIGDVPAADAMLARAEEIAVTGDPAVFGDQYSYQMATTANPILNKAYGIRGVGFYDKAIERAKNGPLDELSRLVVAKGTLLVNLRQPSEAIDCLLYAVKLGESPHTWRAHKMMMEIYLKRGIRQSALVHLDLAIKGAPDGERENLMGLKQRLVR